MSRRFEHVSRSKEVSRAIIAAGGVVYRMSPTGQVQYLLLRSKRGRFWDFPKGRREPGESDLETATREIQEETGVSDFTLLQKLNRSVRFMVKRGKHLIPKEVILFLVQFSRSCNVEISAEHVSFRWLSFEDALATLSYETSARVLREAQQTLAELEF